MDAAAPKSNAAACCTGKSHDALADAREKKLRDVAQNFEATFIAQMLTYAGFAKTVSSEAGFGGEAFSSLLVEQYAKQISARGGFGLSETIYQQLKARESAHDQTA